MKEKNIIKTKRYEAPCGTLMLGAFDDKLCLCDWQVGKHSDCVNRRLKRILQAEFDVGMSEVIEKAEQQLDEFFAGKRVAFDVPLLFAGTDFQKAIMELFTDNTFRKDNFIWRYGKTNRSAEGRPCGCQRQRGQFNFGFAPCHRVIGSDRSLTGYGGGLETKRFLLELEGVL